MSSGPINDLIRSLSKIPGVGPRLAQRMTLFLLKNDKVAIHQLIGDLQNVRQRVHKCSTCGNFTELPVCHICTDAGRDSSLLCIVETVSDLWALERARFYQGKYHVLDGVLSAMENVGPDKLNLAPLLRRMHAGTIKEVIIGLSATLEGQSTLFYLIDLLKPFHVKISSLAQGVPIGGELNYLDNATLSTAFLDRRELSSVAAETKISEPGTRVSAQDTSSEPDTKKLSA
ncbi:MAG: recombination mediator RecR [Holosporales bacterium]|nr:recombination mediator RecR [Holosporales bacterium]